MTNEKIRIMQVFLRVENDFAFVWLEVFVGLQRAVFDNTFYPSVSVSMTGEDFEESTAPTTWSTTTNIISPDLTTPEKSLRRYRSPLRRPGSPFLGVGIPGRQAMTSPSPFSASGKSLLVAAKRAAFLRYLRRNQGARIVDIEEPYSILSRPPTPRTERCSHANGRDLQGVNPRDLRSS